MTIHHHPGDETLMRFAAGTLQAGPALVVAAHLEACASCRTTAADFETLGGALLADIPPTALKADLLERTLSRMDEAERAIVVEPRPSPPRMPDGFILPIALEGCEVGPWRRVVPGVRISRVHLPHGQRGNVILLKVAAGRHMPQHGHSDSEFTQVLTGAFTDGGVRYEAGDMVEADSESEHRPVVGSESECISLAAIEGHIHFRGFIGRMLQPLVRL